MSRVPPLHLTREEALTLMLVAGVGATAFDAPVGIAHDARRRFEEKFGITVTGESIANIIHKVGSLTKESGAEDVEID